MGLFAPVYDRALGWAGHRQAPYYLAGLSFAESTFFPVPPDVMLLPMALARPERAWHFALLTTVASVLGGMAGYAIGYFAFEAIEPWLRTTHYWDAFEAAGAAYARWGFWVVLIAGFSPIPYKIFTIASGVVAMAFPVFVLGSIVGRGVRFFLEAGLIKFGGARMESTIRRNVELLGWVSVALVAIVGAWLALR
ncbi:MAG: YqaA family protein [Pseudomonadota bacterium]